MQKKEEKLRSILRRQGALAVAFSGGVDSSYLLHVAQEELGSSVLAVTACGPLYPLREAEEASRLATALGVSHLLIQSPLPGEPSFDANPPERCYICKKIIFSSLREEARKRGLLQLADGTNADDTQSYRPGLKALEELGVLSPLKMAGLTKEEIRKLSCARGLPTWKRPSSPCLATRFPYGETITLDKLEMVKGAECSLSLLDLGPLRVRYHREVARLEVPADKLEQALAQRDEIVTMVKKAGFSFVALDLEGYRSGSFDNN